MSCLSCKCDCENASARVRKVCVRTKNTKLTVVAGTELGRSPFIIYNYLYGPKAGWVKKKTKACYSCCCSDTHKKKKTLQWGKLIIALFTLQVVRISPGVYFLFNIYCIEDSDC